MVRTIFMHAYRKKNTYLHILKDIYFFINEIVHLLDHSHIHALNHAEISTQLYMCYMVIN